jgi:hypothetical protein
VVYLPRIHLIDVVPSVEVLGHGGTFRRWSIGQSN